MLAIGVLDSTAQKSVQEKRDMDQWSIAGYKLIIMQGVEAARRFHSISAKLAAR
jgi:hypothetical protein